MRAKTINEFKQGGNPYDIMGLGTVAEEDIIKLIHDAITKNYVIFNNPYIIDDEEGTLQITYGLDEENVNDIVIDIYFENNKIDGGHWHLFYGDWDEISRSMPATNLRELEIQLDSMISEIDKKISG
jgi:hypothetical protein